VPFSTFQLVGGVGAYHPPLFRVAQLEGALVVVEVVLVFVGGLVPVVPVVLVVLVVQVVVSRLSLLVEEEVEVVESGVIGLEMASHQPSPLALEGGLGQVE